MRHERFDAEVMESSNSLRMIVLAIAIVAAGAKLWVDKYVAEAKVDCVHAGVRETDDLKACVNKGVYGALYPHVPDIFLLSVNDVRVPENVVVRAGDE